MVTAHIDEIDRLAVQRSSHRQRPHYRSHVKSLRRKIADTGGDKNLVRSIYGVGIKWRVGNGLILLIKRKHWRGIQAIYGR